MSGAWQIPHTGGVNVSGVVQANSGTPFTLTDDTTDPNLNGNFEEPLPAGTYSGVSAAFPQNAITVENKGGFNGARGPGLFPGQHARGLSVQAAWQLARFRRTSTSST